MRFKDNGTSVIIWINARETEQWARRWPCSTLRGRRVVAAFDRNGLLEFAVDGRTNWDGDGHEFNALTSDFLARRLRPEHPCWYITVGQFRGGS